MKKQQSNIVIYRRNFFGFLVKVASYNGREFEARISTAGILRINKMYADRNGIIAAYTPEEWSICKNFVADYSSK